MTVEAVRPRSAAPVAAKDRKGRRTARARAALSGYGFLAPTMLLMGVLLFVPIVWSFFLSFTEFQGFRDPEWTGLDNYARLVSDPVFWQSLGNTVVFTALTVPIDMAAGVGLAVLLNSVLPGRGIFRTIIVLPMVISGVASAMISIIIFYQSSGIITKTLQALGLPPIAWQSESLPAMLSLVLTAIWLRVGFNMIIYLAGLQNISPELYEAARIDGATRWQQFRFITLPLLGPSSFFLLIMNVIASFQVFDLVFIMTAGGPGFSTSVLVTYAYRNGFEISEQGYGAALGIVILLITLVFTYIQWRSSRTRDLVE